MSIIKKSDTENKTEQNNKYAEALQTIFSNGLASNNILSSGMTTDDLKDIENIKLIISAILNDELLESLTNLEPEELDDINDAFYLNEYFDNPRIDIFILHRLKLSRSKIKTDEMFNNLLNIFADISGKSMRIMNPYDDKSIFGNRFKK